MSKIPCKKCPDCGLCYDISVITCSECGINLQSASLDKIPKEKIGEIDETTLTFAQKCSACGALNFLLNKNKLTKVCYKCRKTRVASVTPVAYNISEVKNDVDTPIETNNEQAKIIAANNDSEEFKNILGNVKNIFGMSQQQEKQNAVNITNDEKNDDEDEIVDWPIDSNEIILTALRYGNHSFTIDAKLSSQYLLGRSAHQSDFLSNDRRVGNEHCSISFKNGYWYVKDNHSANGTAVNSLDIGLDGEHILNDGDELKLGHNHDSMAFRVTIKKSSGK